MVGPRCTCFIFWIPSTFPCRDFWRDLYAGSSSEALGTPYLFCVCCESRKSRSSVCLSRGTWDPRSDRPYRTAFKFHFHLQKIGKILCELGTLDHASDALKFIIALQFLLSDNFGTRGPPEVIYCHGAHATTYWATNTTTSFIFILKRTRAIKVKSWRVHCISMILWWFPTSLVGFLIIIGETVWDWYRQFLVIFVHLKLFGISTCRINHLIGNWLEF